MMEAGAGTKRQAPVELESVTKKLQLKSKGRVFGVVRESYLRYLFMHLRLISYCLHTLPVFILHGLNCTLH